MYEDLAKVVTRLVAQKVPTFVTHYHRPDRAPFLNLSDLDGDALASTLADLEASGLAGESSRRFGPRYMELRRRTESLLRDRFIRRGGQPERQSPHYFVLGESAWFRGLYRDAAEIRIRLDDIPSEHVSITYPDSVTSMGLLRDYGIDQPTRAHHGKVFRADELAEVIGLYGLPVDTRPESYDGHQSQDFEHYIEVQVWSDAAVLLPAE